MAIAVQVVSSHPVFIRAVGKILAHVKNGPISMLPAAATETEAMGLPTCPRLFLLDGCSLANDLGPLAGRCRASVPGSKALALLPPGKGSSCSEKIRLFYWGIDGFVELHRSWQAELPKAIDNILRGQLWVPPEVLLAFVNQAKAMLNTQVLQGSFLTAREGQVLQLLMRRLTNKEISLELGISQRTAKFHVSNILNKLHLDGRHRLAPDRLELKLSRERFE